MRVSVTKNFPYSEFSEILIKLLFLDNTTHLTLTLTVTHFQSPRFNSQAIILNYGHIKFLKGVRILSFEPIRANLPPKYKTLTIPDKGISRKTQLRHQNCFTIYIVNVQQHMSAYTQYY